MRKSRAGWWMAAVGAGLLTACADSPVAPGDGMPRQHGPSLDASGCGGGLDMKTAVMPPGSASGVSLRPGWGQPIAGVTVRATFSGASFGLPFNITQMMTFAGGGNMAPLPCFEAQGESYEVTALEVIEPIPAPDGVDPNFWVALSPREKRALIKWAETYLRLHDGYRSIGSVIAERFEQQLGTMKARAKIRAMDFYGGSQQGELLAGAIYGCMLYREFIGDPYSPFANDDAQEFASSMVAAFGEAQFTSRPLVGLRFGRNGAFGAGLASIDRSGIDCGTLAFQAAGGAIDVNDPYGGRAPAPPAHGGVPPDQGGTPPGGPGGEDR